MLRLAAVFGAVLLLCPGLASAEDCGAPTALGDGWATAAPADAGFDPAVLCAIGAQFDDWKAADVHAVLVVRDGKIVYERYFTGQDESLGRALGLVTYNAATKHDERSISKSVTSLVVGAALDRGWLKDVDAPVFSFFPEYADLRTPQKDKITVRDLLTMSAGFVLGRKPADVAATSPTASGRWTTRPIPIATFFRSRWRAPPASNTIIAAAPRRCSARS